jgi:medium-chain acyl-[acyl-carrier-protein] hydrolase
MSSPLPGTPWIVRPFQKPAATIRLFCFPFAGGGASAYFQWAREFSATSIEVCAIQLPGRENRLRETPVSSASSLIQSLNEAIQPLLDRPFAFFGHSMGAMLAFELAHSLQSTHRTLPSRLFLSGSKPPRSICAEASLNHLPDAEFVAAIAERYQAVPKEILAQPDLLELSMPKLRADFTLIESYHCAEREPLDIPFWIFGGDSDPTVPVSLLYNWKEYTKNSSAVQIFPGDHFFLNSARAEVLKSVVQNLGN